MNLLTPTPEMLKDPRFTSLWRIIKDWEIGVPGAPNPIPATTAHARAILDAIDDAAIQQLCLRVDRAIKKYAENNPGRPTTICFTPADQATLDAYATRRATHPRETPNDGNGYFRGLVIIDTDADEIEIS